jgi:hypothetical protein
LFVLVLVLVIERSRRISLYGSITITSTAPHGGTEHEHDSVGNGTKADLPIKYHQFIAD